MHTPDIHSLPETITLHPEKRPQTPKKDGLVFQPSIFKCKLAFSFREGTWQRSEQLDIAPPPPKKKTGWVPFKWLAFNDPWYPQVNIAIGLILQAYEIRPTAIKSACVLLMDAYLEVCNDGFGDL